MIKERKAYIVLVIISLVFSVAAVIISLRQIDINDHKFCDVVKSAIAVPVQKPVNPSANPSREANYKFYVKFVALDHSLGC